jgi:hypothetical protein
VAQKYWDQSRFDEAMKRLGRTLPQEKLPRAVTKKGFFIALRAMAATPKKEASGIQRELETPVTLTAYHSPIYGDLLAASSGQGRTAVVPLGYMLAAKIVAKTWQHTRMSLGEKNKSGRSNERRAYLAAIAKAYKKLLGTRKRGIGFLRIGWLSVVRLLGPYVGNRAGAPRADTSGLRIRGQMKGEAKPAKPGWMPSCTINNKAQARSDRRYGLVRYGGPALQKAFNDETADLVSFLDKEIKPDIEAANKELR